MKSWFLLVLALLTPLLTACSMQNPSPSSQDTRSGGTPAADSLQVTVNRSSPTGESSFSPGISLVDNSLDYPWKGNDPTAVNRVKTLIKQAIPFENTYIMAWGAPDPWPDPSQREPSNWSYLDDRLQFIHETGGVPVISLSEAPWWMKGELQSNGTTRLLQSSDEWASIAYNSRILDNKMDAWLHLVQRVAERYMAPPYNVRYFQVWNELKGYYNPVTNAYDYSNSPGNPGKPVATHGYTYMYNQVYQRLMQVAGSLSIPQGSIYVGGPYMPMDTWGSHNQSSLSTFSKAYGTYDQRSLDVLLYWLQHKIGAGFISLDAGNSNRDDIVTADAFTASEKFADVTRWIRSLSPKQYPGATTLPIWWSEWYVLPYGTKQDDQYNTALKTYALMKLVQAGGAVALSWGGLGLGSPDTGLWTATGTANGGQPTAWYFAYKDFKDFFPPGTKLYATRVSNPSVVEALASATHVMLVNKTATNRTVQVNGTTVTLGPYQVRVVAL